MTADLARVKSNVAKMVEMNAPEEDIDAYIAEEGTTVDAVRAFEDKPAQRGTAYTRLIESNPVTAGLVGLGGGLVKAATGAIQAGAQVLGADGIAEAAGRVTQNVNRDVDNLGMTGKAASVVGEVAPYVALPASAATLGGRVALGAAAGSAQGALQAQETPDMAQRGKDAALGAAVGAVVPAALTGAGKLVKGTANIAKSAATSSRSAEQLDAASDALKQTANASYQAARDAGAMIAKPTGVNIANRVEQAVAGSGKLNDRLHGDTISVMRDFSTAVRQGNIGLEELDQFRQLFGDVVKRNTTKLEGSNADAMKASAAIDAIDDAVEGLGKTDILGGDTAAVDTLLKARGEWQKYRKFQAVADVVKSADGDPNKIKSGLKRMLANPKRLRGFSKEEISGLKEAAENSTAEYMAKGLGRFGLDPSNVFMPAIGGSLLTFGVDGGAGAALVISGTGARHLHKLVGRGKAEKVLSLIEKGGDAQQLVASVGKIAGPQRAKALRAIADSIPDKAVRDQFMAVVAASQARK